MNKLAIAGLALAAAPLAGIAAPATQASASTTGCTDGTYAGYCGTQTEVIPTDSNGSTQPLSWDVAKGKASLNVQIIGYPNSDNDQATDFYTFAYDGGPSKVFEYAPGGIASNYCVSEPSKGAGLVLRQCNGSTWQRFTADAAADGYTWANKATGDVVTAGADRAQLVGETEGTTVASGQEFQFDN